MRVRDSWIVGPAERGMCLLDFLAEKLSISKRRAKALLDQRRVFVNHQRIWMAKHLLRSDDHVEVFVAQPPHSGKPIPVLLEDELVLVIDKPPGVAVDGPGGILQRVRDQCDCPVLMLVHRLDRDTSGCLLLAKAAPTRERLVREFELGTVKKLYHAIVRGRFPEERRLIAWDIEGKRAVTHVRVLSANALASHLQLEIETGRTHQIRIHMKRAGHPVVGDAEYDRQPLADIRFRSVPRQMLHARKLVFPHPLSRRLVSVESPLPADFRATLRKFELE